MNFIKPIIEFLFSCAVLANTVLFIFQGIKIYQDKTAKGVSLLTFIGFFLIQSTIVLHGIIWHDVLLVCGYIASMLACAIVVVLILVYKFKR